MTLRRRTAALIAALGLAGLTGLTASAASASPAHTQAAASFVPPQSQYDTVCSSHIAHDYGQLQLIESNSCSLGTAGGGLPGPVTPEIVLSGTKEKVTLTWNEGSTTATVVVAPPAKIVLPPIPAGTSMPVGANEQGPNVGVNAPPGTSWPPLKLLPDMTLLVSSTATASLTASASPAWTQAKPMPPRQTAGPAGLDVTIATNTQSYDFTAAGTLEQVSVPCPADHPYVLGGGGTGTPAAPTGMNDVTSLPSSAGSGPEGTSNGWTVRGVPGGSGGQLQVWAVCAK